ncbi:GNAT family N-acetyltransferase [Rhodobacteraceae bacterium DSL-40]|uniref:GNAT family N-acetyltransferase n=1 Tax=Amaricoccus sp. B4 TaxID=3368557 RepID=UPI000DABBAEA
MLTIRTMTEADLGRVLDWAALEGWNPGRDDARTFFASDPEGFLIGEIGGEPVAAISVVRHAPEVGFLGLYICRPEWRGQGHGLALWQAGIARRAGASIGLDGVVAQQTNYRRSGFALSHRNIRFSGPAPAPDPIAEGIRPITPDLVAAVIAYDAAIAGYARPAYLRAWLAPSPHRTALVLLRGARIRGYGVLRACLEGSKIGPLFADGPGEARALFTALARHAGDGPVILDVPEPNVAATALAWDFGLTPGFETARMWLGPPPPEDPSRTFGVASFELG